MRLRIIKAHSRWPGISVKRVAIALAVLALCAVSLKLWTFERDVSSPASLSAVSSAGQPTNTEAGTDNGIRDEKTIESDFFAGYRMERERVRGKQIEILNGVINQADGDKEAKILAATQLVKITADWEKEMKAENLVKSKGYPECVVLMMAGNTSVVLKTRHLSTQDEIDIKGIVSQALDCNEEELCIIIKAE